MKKKTYSRMLLSARGNDIKTACRRQPYSPNERKGQENALPYTSGNFTGTSKHPYARTPDSVYFKNASVKSRLVTLYLIL